MISPARRLCYQILCHIESRRLFSDDALNSEEMNRLTIRDRHLTTEIVYGTLRWQALLDYVLANASSLPWHKVEPRAKILLRMGLYQMWQMDRIPDHALVNDAVELAKHELGKGIDGYVNGILRRLTRTRPWNEHEFLAKAPKSTQASLPEWLWNRWAERYGEIAAINYALSLNKPPQPALRGEGEAGEYDRLAFAAIRSDLVPDAYIRTAAVPEQQGGESIPFRLQDEASQLIPHLLGKASGWMVWDACAAPGGKSAILCKICGRSGRVIASDLRSERISRLVRFVRSQDTLKGDVIIADASKPPPFRDCFDAVVADVPCSGLGTLRRNPEIKWQFQPEEFASLQQYQSLILQNVSEAVRVGGCLLYSTCSTEPEENELVVTSFLHSHSEFDIKRPVAPSGIEKWICQDQMVRTFPSTRLWDGFFAALLVRQK